MSTNYSRRGFLSRTTAAAGAAMVGLSLPQFLAACKEAGQAREEPGGSFKVLSFDEATELEAIASLILPTTETPGAREAGAIYFIDHVLAKGRPDLLDPVRAGLADLASRAQSDSPGAETFSDVDEKTQIAILTRIEESDFFQTVRLLTLAGVLADPSYGGNRDRLGWDLIGFEGHFAFAPPFGYYDAHHSDDPPGGPTAYESGGGDHG